MPRNNPGDATQLPDAFLERMRGLLSDSYPAWLDSYRDDPVYGLRVNTLKATAADLQSNVSWNLEPIPWCSAGFYIDPEIRAGRHPYHAAGLYYLQEPSAMAAVEALDVQPGQWVLDISGSPGGKSTQIASRLGGSGVLVANDPVAGRVRALGENLERCAVRNAVITNAPASAFSTSMARTFDRVLVDAPCSGEGLFRKSPSARREWSDAHVAGSSNRQRLLLDDIAGTVKPSGLLVYSTCTFNIEENESQIWRFLETHPAWSLEPIANPALARLHLSLTSTPSDGHLSAGMGRIWPHRDRGEGHFVALLRAPEADDATVAFGQGTNRRLTEDVPPVVSKEWSDFHRTFTPGFTISGILVRKGEHVYESPSSISLDTQLRVVRPGFPVGMTSKKRFIPSHALALALRPSDATLSENLDFQQAMRYLQGETLSISGPLGWVLLTIDGYSLGWGKRSSGVIKNHYPKGLRWQRSVGQTAAP